MFRFFVFFTIALVAASMLGADPKDGVVALLVVTLLTGLFLVVFRRYTDEKEFITLIFLAAICTRLIFGIVVHVYDLQEFAGPDSYTYHEIGSKIVDFWLGSGNPSDPELRRIMSVRGPGWGMNYTMAAIYLVAGKSPFVAQSFFTVIGAATIPLVYFCALGVFQNKRVAKTSAIIATFFPAFIIWSGQLLKDGVILFFLVLVMTMVISAQKKFSWAGLFLIVASMIAILSFRFYIFYMVTLAVTVAFTVGIQTSIKAMFQRTAILMVIGASLMYLGVIRIASVDLETYGSFERVQISRTGMIQGGESGYGAEGNVSTLGGAISALPVGFAYLMFAPFPWEMKNFRQSITLPDILLWWSMIPFLIYGLWYTIRHRLRASLPILTFAFLLTISYSVFQGNIGAAYRQRTQIQVFLFMFVAVGLSLIREKIEDKKTVEIARKNELNRRLKARFQEQQKAT